MNYQQTPGGALKPIWHPPIPMEWIVSFLLIIGASNIEALPSFLHKTLMNPIGFFFTFLFAIAAFDAGYKVVPFAILFVLLLIWVLYERSAEGFQVSGTIDWVQNKFHAGFLKLCSRRSQWESRKRMSAHILCRAIPNLLQDKCAQAKGNMMQIGESFRNFKFGPQ